ncbi:MAG: dienelactone hydrolase family protein [Planctomycetota bacterium]
MEMLTKIPLAILAMVVMTSGFAHCQQTLPSMREGAAAPSNFAEMWAGFDPRAEPIETEVIREWEEEGVVMRIVRFRIGMFKGKKSILAAVYGFPKSAAGGAEKVPGLVQIHGGGQYAHYNACLQNGKRGYATVSIAWAGRISAPDYNVNPDGVALFWEGNTDDPQYKLTTDWGALDGYHAPSRNPQNNFPSAQPWEWTIDSVESPRNSPWFICALAARRAITFLEQQPEVDPERIGVYGHSMGGKLTVMTSVDPRVKAAAPSCGGISDRDNDSELFCATVGDGVSLEQLSCPIIFLSPSNDFHGRIGDLPGSIEEIQSDQWRVTCSPHSNHQDAPEFEVATQLWFDQHLQNRFQFPQTPVTTLTLDTESGIPEISFQPDTSMPIRSAGVFYTQQGKENETRFDRENTMSRYWHYAPVAREGDKWTAQLPLGSTDKPLWVFANVLYDLEETIAGAGYYYGTYETDCFNVSSLIQMVSPDELAAAGVKATLQPATMIESFEGDWRKSWFSYRRDQWTISTHKVYDDIWKAPEGARLAIQVRAGEANKMVFVIDDLTAEVALIGENEWQNVVLSPADFQSYSGEGMDSWEGIKTLKLTPAQHLRPARGEEGEPRVVGGGWKGDPPEFRNLQWVTGEASTSPAVSGNTAAMDSQLLDVFPASVFGTGDSQRVTTVATDYSPSGSLWGEGLDEQWVFQAAIENEQGTDNSYSLRVGKGGQIYSLRAAFGESVPPSWKTESPWNDEVWQFVAVCSKYNGIKSANRAAELPEDVVNRINGTGFQNSFFIHNSGAYIREGDTVDHLYCPLLAAESDPDDNCYRMVNWGLVPQLKTIHRSPLLYYTQVRDAGNGVIELTWVVHNFSVRDDMVFDYVNAPWGGTRISTLPHRFVSLPDNELLSISDRDFGSNIHRVDETGGWAISCADESEDAPSLALVYGLDKNFETEQASQNAGQPFCQRRKAIFRAGRAHLPMYDSKWTDWMTREENTFRNYDVVEFVPGLKVEPGESIWFRSYLVVGNKRQVIEQAKALVDSVDYGLVGFDRNTESTVPVNPTLSNSDTSQGGGFGVFARPVAGSKPLFLIRQASTGNQIVTTDPYYFVTREKLNLDFPGDHPLYDYYSNAVGYTMDLHDSRWQSLVGFAMVDKPSEGNWKRLSELLDSGAFPEATTHHLDLWVEVVADGVAN